MLCAVSACQAGDDGGSRDLLESSATPCRIGELPLRERTVVELRTDLEPVPSGWPGLAFRRGDDPDGSVGPFLALPRRARASLVQVLGPRGEEVGAVVRHRTTEEAVRRVLDCSGYVEQTGGRGVWRRRVEASDGPPGWDLVVVRGDRLLLGAAAGRRGPTGLDTLSLGAGSREAALLLTVKNRDRCGPLRAARLEREDRGVVTWSVRGDRQGLRRLLRDRAAARGIEISIARTGTGVTATLHRGEVREFVNALTLPPDGSARERC